MKSLPAPLRRSSLLLLLALAGGIIACDQIFKIVPGVESGSGGHAGASAVETSSTGGARSTNASGTASSTGSTGGAATTTSSGSTTSTTSTGGSGATDAGVSLADCVLLLDMDEPSWSGVPGEVKDTSGKQNNGTAQGTATTTAAGEFGRAGLFDGNGWVDVPNSASLQPTVALTYAAWIYPTGLIEPPPTSQSAPSPGIIAKRQGFGQEVAFTLFLWSNNNAFVDLQGATLGLLRFSSQAVFANATWYHLAVVYDGTVPSVVLYVNGAVDTSMAADTSLAASMADVLIGNLPGGGNTYTGVIDEVVIWNRALSAGEIQNLYNATTEL